MQTREKRLQKTAKEICRKLKASGHSAYFVGGAVRDILLGIEPDDYDIVTSATPMQNANIFTKTIPVGVNFGIILVVENDHPFELATFRSDGAYADGRRPLTIASASAREDVLRRDFTVNGLLMEPFSGEIIDYVNGRQDLADRIIRTIGKPTFRFTEDHLRMLRAVRFSASLDFAIEEETLAAIKQNAHKISNISEERIHEEITKILISGGARRGFSLLMETGLLAEIMPEIVAMKGCHQPSTYHPEGDVWEHTLLMLSEVDKIENVDPCLAWAALLHDVGKASTLTCDDRGVHFYGHDAVGMEIVDRIARRQKFSSLQTKIILRLVGEHMRFINVKAMRENKLKRFLRQEDFPLHLALHRMDCMASHGLLDSYHFCQERLQSLSQEELHPPKIISGNDLLALGLSPSPMIKKILTLIEDAQLEGKISTKAAALAMAKEVIENK